MSPNIKKPRAAPASIWMYCVGANKDDGKCLAELIIKIKAIPLMIPLKKFNKKSFRFIVVKLISKKVPENNSKKNFP